MKKRFCEEQIIGALREAEAWTGMPVEELCRKHGFGEATSYAKAGGKKAA